MSKFVFCNQTSVALVVDIRFNYEWLGGKDIWCSRRVLTGMKE